MINHTPGVVSSLRGAVLSLRGAVSSLRRLRSLVFIVALVGCAGGEFGSATTTSSTVVASGPLTDFPAVEQMARESLLGSLTATPLRTEITVDFESAVSDEMRELIEENIDHATERLQQYLDGVDELHIVVIATTSGGRELVKRHAPDDPDFLADIDETMANESEWGKGLPPCRGMGGFAVGYTDVPLLVIDAGSGCRWLDDSEEESGVDVSSDVVAHELFHIAQTTLAASDNVRCAAPIWMVEGQAVAAGWALGVMYGEERYDETRNATLEWMEEPPTADALDNLEGESTTGREYDHGALAVEYLVARNGWDSTIALLERAGEIVDGACPSDAAVVDAFAEAFFDVYGQTLNEFYDEVEPYIDWVYDTKPTR